MDRPALNMGFDLLSRSRLFAPAQVIEDIEALSVLEPEDVQDARRWFADYGVELPTLPVSPEDKAVIRISEQKAMPAEIRHSRP